MNRYLLDTKVFLMVLDGFSALPAHIRAVFSQKDAVFYVSAASFFEIAVKKALKQVKTPDNLPEIAFNSGLTHLPLTAEHAMQTVRLPYHHTDPYDRMLIAQAKQEGLTLVSDNAIFGLYDIQTLLPEAA